MGQRSKKADAQTSVIRERARPLEPPVSTVRDANERLVEALVRADENAETQQTEMAASHGRESELREIGELRERILGIVGHDLRNPLNTISMASGILASSPNLGPAEVKLARQIVDSSRRMRGIIAQILDFTRVRLGATFPLTPQPADLGDIVRVIAEERRITTDTPIVVEAHGDLRGSWDAERLGATVANLLSNAVQHAADGTPVVVEVHAMGEPRVACTVSNEGPTIPPELQQVIFEPFRQGDPLAGRAKDNLGLGLYIASEIVHAHGGTLTLHSEAGRTAFTFELPRRLE